MRCYTGWNDKIVALEKTTWFHFHLMKSGFLFSTLEGTAQRIGRPVGQLQLWSLPPHIFEVGSKVNTKVYLDVLKTVMISWCNQVAGGRPWLWLCTLLSLVPLLPRLEPVGLIPLVIDREHHQYHLPQHQRQPDHRHPPSIRRAPAGACGKGMLSVPDPYRAGDWGWRWLHWTDVSSTT